MRARVPRFVFWGPGPRRSLFVALPLVAAIGACGWNPSRPFEREAPPVKEALSDLDAGDAGSAASKLGDYLSTGPCKDGNIGTPDDLKRRADGTLDLGLALFRIGEHFGRRFGEEEIDANPDENTRSQRHAQTECARRVVEAIADDPAIPLELRARARYLVGNLAFLDGDYEGAVRAYDRALVLAPGEQDAGDDVGRDAAWNRAIALRRIEDKKDAGQDAAPDADDAGGRDASRDGGAPDASQDGSSAGPDGGGAPDGGGDSGQDAGPQSAPDAAPPERPDAGAQPPPPSRDQDERILDQLESAPTFQQEDAKHRARKPARGMLDK